EALGLQGLLPFRPGAEACAAPVAAGAQAHGGLGACQRGIGRAQGEGAAPFLEAVATHSHMVGAQVGSESPRAAMQVAAGLYREAGVASGGGAVHPGAGVRTVEQPAFNVAIEAARSGLAQGVAVRAQATEVDAGRRLPAAAAVVVAAHPAFGADLAEREAGHQARRRRVVAADHPAIEVETATGDAGALPA